MNDQEKAVIQCPTCQTKFEVPGKMLAVAGTPKFHCSRCDSLFVGYEHTPSKKETLEASPEPAQEMAAPLEAPETQEQESAFDETELENEDAFEEEHEEEAEYEEDEDSEEEEYEEEDDSEEYEEEDSEEEEDSDEEDYEEEDDSEEYYDEDEESEEEEDDDEYEDEEDLEEDEEDSEEYEEEEDDDESDSEMEELTRLTQQEPEPTRTRPTVIVDRDMIAEVRRLREETEAKKQSGEIPEPEQVPFRFDPKPREDFPQQAESQELQPEQPQVERTAVIEEITFPEVEPEPTEETVELEIPEKEDTGVIGMNFGAPQDDTIEIPEESALPQSETFAHLGDTPPQLTPPPSYLRTISTIGGPLLAFLFVLFFTGEYLKIDSSTTRGIHSALFPNEPQIAPADLRIQDLAFSTVDLSSGKQVPVISGKIINRSDSAFRSVLLEGVVFDERGQSLKTARASLSNELTKDKITSLTPEVISQLQDGTNKGRKLLKPGEKRDFLLAFPGTEDDLKFYTARIYSVKKVG